MRVCGIVCEFNPFHNGHKYLIDTIRDTGFDAVVGIMSGNFTQRGEIAIFNKRIRAKAAIKNGMDLVLELPAVHAMQTAERFAQNAVYILDSLGQVDALAFGSETGDTDTLTKIARLVAFEPPRFKDALKSELDFGKPFFTARSAAVERILGTQASDIISEPNNILGIEYIKALLRFESKIEPIAIKRRISAHRSSELTGAVSSASAVRSELKKNNGRVFEAIPENLRRLYLNAEIHDVEHLSAAIISKIMLTDAETLRTVSDVGEGLENKLVNAARTSRSFAELCDNVKSKRYAHSRIRRIALSAFLGITKAEAAIPPKYIRILDFNETGKELLHRAKKTAALPLAKNRNSIKNEPSALQIWDRELIFDDIYEL